jgi:hypothetical protein
MPHKKATGNRFVKGRSGNLAGRPPRSVNLATIMRREHSRRVPVIINDRKIIMKVEEGILLRIARLVATGDPAMINLLVESSLIDKIFSFIILMDETDGRA